MRFNFNKFTNREQILILGFIILIFISALISFISWLNTKNQSLEKENQNIISRLNYIESIPSSVSSNRNLYSDNISILVNSTSSFGIEKNEPSILVSLQEMVPDNFELDKELNYVVIANSKRLFAKITSFFESGFTSSPDVKLRGNLFDFFQD